MERDRCEALEAQVSAYADNELSGADRERVDRHLLGCASCRATVDRYRAMGIALCERIDNATPELSAIAWPPAGEHPAPARALTPRRGLIYHVTRWLDPWPVLAGAAALLAVVIGLQFLDVQKPPTNVVEIERLDAAGSVMVIPGQGGRMTIIWVFEADDQPIVEPTAI